MKKTCLIAAALLLAMAPAACAAGKTEAAIRTDAPGACITISVTRAAPPSPAEALAEYSQSDLDELARIVYWEARGEPDDGKIAVAQVVLNRVASDIYPNTIAAVIAQKDQFSPYSCSDYYTASVPQDCRDCARRALEGEKVVAGDVMWFRSDKGPDTWYGNALAASIGGHWFYALT